MCHLESLYECRFSDMLILLYVLLCVGFKQYGYIFFLSKKVDAQLYAQTNASSQCVQLMLRRETYTSKMRRKNEKEYFPLTGVSYVVMKVSEGCGPINIEERDATRRHHRQRLDSMLQMSNAFEMLSSMQGKKKPLKKSGRNHRR